MAKHTKSVFMQFDTDLLRAIDSAAGPGGRTRWLEDAAHDKIENDAIRAAPKSPTGGAILAGDLDQGGPYYPPGGCTQCGGSGYIEHDRSCGDLQCFCPHWTSCPNCGHH